MTQPVAGTFKGFSATCTHQGCKVNEVAGGTINCPCHGSKFAVARRRADRGPGEQAAAGEGGDGAGRLRRPGLTCVDCRQFTARVTRRGEFATRGCRSVRGTRRGGGGMTATGLEQEPTDLAGRRRRAPAGRAAAPVAARARCAVRARHPHRAGVPDGRPARARRLGRSARRAAPARPRPGPGRWRAPWRSRSTSCRSPLSAGCCSPWRHRWRSAPWRWPTATAAPGFVCEGYAAGAVPDISAYGGWRGYLAAATQSD